jgi:hypothetical protein
MLRWNTSEESNVLYDIFSVIVLVAILRLAELSFSICPPIVYKYHHLYLKCISFFSNKIKVFIYALSRRANTTLLTCVI